MKTPENNCPFCNTAREQIIVEHSLAVAKHDGYPLTKGHSLIIPRRHVASFFDCTAEERHAMLELLGEVKVILDKEHAPDGYNIGLNNGTAAGQTVMHVHMHLIPRFAGDKSDPRGGVRWIFPEKAKYWEALAIALKTQARENPVTLVVDSPYGKRYSVDGAIETPDNRQPRPRVRTVWILETGTEVPRLITAHPV